MLGFPSSTVSVMLVEVVLPPNLEVIEMCTFKNCLSLKNVKLPRMLWKIDSEAFADTALECIDMSEGIQYLAHDAFDEKVKVSISMSQMREMLDDLWFYGRKHDEELFLR